MLTKKVLYVGEIIKHFHFHKMGSCFSTSSSAGSTVVPSDFSPSPALPLYVILNKVGKKGRGKWADVDWYKTGVLVEKMNTIEEEELPVS